jgi:hypothetical protein
VRTGLISRKSEEKEEQMSATTSQDWQQGLSTSELELLRELALALRGIRYGSVVLTVHDGRIVELNKTERIRKNSG